MSAPIRFVVPGQPIGKGRPRATKIGGSAPLHAGKTCDYEGLIGLHGALAMAGKPDKDNVIKAIYDGLNGVCWVDDAQVCEGVQRKRYAAEPGVTVEIEELA